MLDGRIDVFDVTCFELCICSMAKMPSIAIFQPTTPLTSFVNASKVPGCFARHYNLVNTKERIMKPALRFHAHPQPKVLLVLVHHPSLNETWAERHRD